MAQRVASIATSSRSPLVRGRTTAATTAAARQKSSNVLLEGSIGGGLETARGWWNSYGYGGTEESVCPSTTNEHEQRRSHSIRSRLLPGIHPLHLFRIVQDVDRYQEFLPLCTGSEVRSVTNGGRTFSAEMVVGFGVPSLGLGPGVSRELFRTRYVSEVTVDPDRLTITTKSGGGVDASARRSGDPAHERTLFESLASSWRLLPAPAPGGVVGTLVDFGVEMVVGDPVTASVLDRVLGNVAEKQVRAFRDRCLVLPPPTPSELEHAELFVPTTTTTTGPFATTQPPSE